MPKININLNELAMAYNKDLPTLNPEEQLISVQIYRLLVEGKPVSQEEIAMSLNYPIDKVNAFITNWFAVYYNDDKNIIGYLGMALQRMPHRFEVDNKTVYTWCAWDSLFIPELLQKTARVESNDPITNEKIRFTVTPDEIF